MCLIKVSNRQPSKKRHRALVFMLIPSFKLCRYLHEFLSAVVQYHDVKVSFHLTTRRVNLCTYQIRPEIV